MCCSVLSCISCVQLFAALWTVACQTPLSMGFFRQEHWSGLPYPPPGDLPNPEIRPESLISPALAGGFLTTSAIWEAQRTFYFSLLFLEYRTKSCPKQYGLNLLSNSILLQELPFGHAVLSAIIFFFLFISYITPNFLSAFSSIIIYLACSAALVICFPSTFPLFHSIFPFTFISVVIHGLLVSHTNYKLQQDISVFIHYFMLRTLTQCLIIVGILQLLAQ